MSKPKLKHSNYMITINPNKQNISHMSESDFNLLESSFSDAIQNIFSPNGFKRFLKLYDPKTRSKYSVDIDDKIYDLSPIDGEYHIEIGKNERRLHAHSLISFSHRTTFQIDAQELQTMFEELGFNGVYINLKTDTHANFDRNQWINSVLDYIRKDEKTNLPKK